MEKRKSKKMKLFLLGPEIGALSLTLNTFFMWRTEGKKMEIYTDKEMIETYAVMCEMEWQLGNGSYRCHRGYVVNMAHITEFQLEQFEGKINEIKDCLVYRTTNFMTEMVKDDKNEIIMELLLNK